ncbi:MAG: FAD-dependent oxidoreductase, partial [Solirubrobacterales bacterium]|nr:FAD-dependent oxidoreductase [Solirubrobacterales bacterium]
MTLASADQATRPVILVIEEEPLVDVLADDLKLRFAGEFRVLHESSADAGLRTLEELAAKEDAVALVIAGESIGGTDGGVQILAGAKGLHPLAKRVLLVGRNYTTTNPVVKAMTFGQIDYHLTKPWRRDKNLYPAVTEFLANWTAAHNTPSGGIFQIVGPRDTPRALEIREILTSMGMPFICHSEDSEAGRQLLEQSGRQDSALPVMIRYDGLSFAAPSAPQVLEALGMRTRTSAKRCDLAILGAGPAGLAAAVYGASEGLETTLVGEAAGGQAGTSSLIRNYLGFAHGVSGQDFVVEACEQAWLFGADLVYSQSATGLTLEGTDKIVRMSDGTQVTTKAVIIAVGVSWRRLGVPAVEALIGAGVFYGAAGSEVKAMQGQDVYVVGAGNSAGQAALSLADHAASVTIVMRGESLRTSMSEYLITELSGRPNVAIRATSEVVGGGGNGRLERLELLDRSTGSTETVDAGALFVMIGAEPETDWLPAAVARDDGGYILTGRDLEHGSDPGQWPLERPPLPLETSVPGVFAAGDVRSRSVKRVASAVGEGAAAVQM